MSTFEVGTPSSPEQTGESPRDAGPLLVALLGRPNSGKSSLFNAVTGESAHVGNFPGITVDVLEAAVTVGGAPATMCDLPGLYSLDPRLDVGTDERIARDFLIARRDEGARVVAVQVIDATHLALGLRLTKSLREHAPEVPLAIAVTQADVLAKEGRDVDGAALEKALGVPVAVTSARDPACKSVVLGLVARVTSEGEGRISHVEPAWDPDALAKSVTHVKRVELAKKAARARSDRLDAVLLHPFLGPILFFAIMSALFAAVFLIADPATDACAAAVDWIGAFVRPRLGSGWVASLLVDGALGGVGTVLAFLPQILLLIAAMELLESTGYLARAAFLVDRLFRVAGLGGKAFMPLLTAHACAVPAIAATRVLRDPKERLTTILVIPLMTCSARLPVYSLLVATFFGGGALKKALVTTCLYLTGMVSGLLAAVILRRTVTKGRGLPLALEMPVYRAPMLSLVWKRCKLEAADFLKKVGTVILAASIGLWAMLSIPARQGPEPLIDRSVAAEVGRALEPITRPLGFDWRINVGLIASFGQRELMVSTMGVIFGVEKAEDEPAPLVDKIRAATRPDGSKAYGMGTALALLAFFVYACQCMSTLSAIRRETRGWKMPAFVMAYTYGVAYAVGLVLHVAARVLSL